MVRSRFPVCAHRSGAGGGPCGPGGGLSGILLAALRPLARKYLKKTRTNVDSLPGTEGIVTEDIHNLEAVGRVKLGAMSWAARSTSGDPIPAGTVVRVDRIEGVRAFVTPVKENVEI